MSYSDIASELTEPMLEDTTVSQRLGMKRRLERSMMIALGLMSVEIIGGLMAGSLAILTDAAHVLSDVSGLAVSLFALDLMVKKPTIHYTYGFHQAEILGALGSVMIVWAMTGVLLFEAYSRYLDLKPIEGRLMVGMAAVGLLVNIVMMLTLGHHHNPLSSHSHSHSHSRSESSASSLEEGTATSSSRGSTNMVMQAAVVHIIGDIVQSLGVLLAALLIWLEPFDLGLTDKGVSKWNYADPFCTVFFSIVVMYTTYSTVRQCVRILMQRVPENIDPAAFAEKLKAVNNVSCVHDIHVWAIGSSNPLCTAHIVIKSEADSTQVLTDCIKVAQSMQLHHSTFQLEVEGVFDHHLETFGNVHASSERNCCGDATPLEAHGLVRERPDVTVKHIHSSLCRLEHKAGHHHSH